MAQNLGFGSPKSAKPFDPFPGNFLAPQLQATEGAIGSKINSPSWSRVTAPSAAWNPYVGPRPEQTESIEKLRGYNREAEPLYTSGVGTLQKTAEGGYLDPMEQAPFQRLAASRESIARDLFGDAMKTTNQNAATRGNFDSSVRQAQLGEQARRVGGEAAQDISSAGWTQYGKERELQQDASKYGTQLAPGLADKVFSNSEMLRSAEQAGRTSQLNAETQRQIATMENQLRAEGMDETAIKNAIDYMTMRAKKTQSGQYPTDQSKNLMDLIKGGAQGLNLNGWGNFGTGGGDVPMNFSNIGVGGGDAY